MFIKNTDYIMSKRAQLLISFILLLIFICTTVYSTTFRSDENGRLFYKEVKFTIQKDSNFKNSDIYYEFLKNFNCQGEEYYYSFIQLAGYDYPILLLSNAVYTDNHEHKVAMGTDIYYPVNNQITRFGSIGSDGTAYPISADKSGIFTAGGHNVAKYNLDNKNGKLKLIYKYEMFFYVIGEAVKEITIEFTDDENKIVNDEDFIKANKEYGNANRIYFKRLC